MYSVDMGDVDNKFLHILPWTNLSGYRQTFFPSSGKVEEDMNKPRRVQPWIVGPSNYACLRRAFYWSRYKGTELSEMSERAGNCFSSALTTPAICAAADNRIKVRIKEYNNGENRHN